LESPEDLTALDLMPYLKKVDRLLALASGFKDAVGESCLKEQLECIAEMYKLVTGVVAPQVFKGEWSVIWERYRVADGGNRPEQEFEGCAAKVGVPKGGANNELTALGASGAREGAGGERASGI
jgi:hypothetical protein